MDDETNRQQTNSIQFLALMDTSAAHRPDLSQGSTRATFSTENAVLGLSLARQLSSETCF